MKRFAQRCKNLTGSDGERSSRGSVAMKCDVARDSAPRQREKARQWKDEVYVRAFMNCSNLAGLGVRVMTTLIRNGRDRRSGKPVKCHARKSALLVGTRSANHIRAGGHSGCTQRPDTWLHPNASRKTSDSSCIAGAVHTWHFAT
jgi:hypothetical protein